MTPGEMQPSRSGYYKSQRFLCAVEIWSLLWHKESLFVCSLCFPRVTLPSFSWSDRKEKIRPQYPQLNCNTIGTGLHWVSLWYQTSCFCLPLWKEENCKPSECFVLWTETVFMHLVLIAQYVWQALWHIHVSTKIAHHLLKCASKVHEFIITCVVFQMHHRKLKYWCVDDRSFFWDMTRWYKYL